MRPAAQLWRPALFILVSATLIAAALALSGTSSPPSAATATRTPSSPPDAPPVSRRVARLRAALRVSSRRFLSAFFRYEVGEAGPGVRRALRASATAGFAAELLASPPLRPPYKVAAAVPGRLTIALASALPPRALVSGAAHRGSETEEFSFLFAAVDGVWLASGPGE